MNSTHIVIIFWQTHIYYKENVGCQKVATIFFEDFFFQGKINTQSWVEKSHKICGIYFWQKQLSDMQILIKYFLTYSRFSFKVYTKVSQSLFLVVFF